MKIADIAFLLFLIVSIVAGTVAYSIDLFSR